MQPFTFIHAADLHLDAVLPAPAGEDSPAVSRLLSSAVFTALERLVELCIAEKAAFLVIAGDVFHGGAGSLKAGFAVADACKKLAGHGIEVFWARGNHDSASQSDEAMRWPENLHIFSTGGERFSAGGGAALAELHGISHKSRHERANLAEKLQGAGPGYSIGVLHCAVNGVQGQHAAYAPCNLGDLTSAGKHYWALGHVHGRAVLSEDPFVAYPGSLQGLHVNEPGPHGCFVVRVDEDGKTRARFAPLAPVRWERLELDISELAPAINELEDEALERLRSFCEGLAPEAAGATPSLLLLRLELAGRSALDAPLRRAGSLAELAARLNGGLAALDGTLPFMARLKDVTLSTSPDVDIAALKKSESLVGETLRRADEAAAKLEELSSAGLAGFPALEEALAETAWGPDFMAALRELYGERRLEDARALPGVDELAAMAREAAALCLHLFEVEE